MTKNSFCLLLLLYLISHEIFGQKKEVEIIDMGCDAKSTSINVSAESPNMGIISFLIFPNFLKLKFDAKKTGICNTQKDSVQSEYKLIMYPFHQKQTITIEGYGIDTSVEINGLKKGSCHKYHLICLSKNMNNDSIIEAMSQQKADSISKIYRDSIRKIYQDSIYRTFQKPKKRLVKDWSKDFKLIMGLSNGIVAGELGGGYVEVKFGEKTGIALEGGYGLGLGKIYDVRWSGGVKGYYKYWFLSTHYGTTTTVMNKNSSFHMNDDGSYLLKGQRSSYRKGVTLLCGYDRNWKWFHLTAGIGTTLTTSFKPKFLPAWNIGIGISIPDIVAN